MVDRPRKLTTKNELQTHIELLRKLSLQLNSLSEELNQTVLAVEHFLGVTCSLGISVGALVEADSSEELQTYLEYRRVGGKFRIAVVEIAEQGEINVRPWSDCPRDEKLKTFAKLPDLLANLAETIQVRIKQALEARQSVKPILEGLAHNPGDNPDDIPF